jgi:hypothetical protein
MLGNQVILPDVLPVWCRLQGSNLQLPGYEPGALPVVRKRHTLKFGYKKKKPTM